MEFVSRIRWLIIIFVILVFLILVGWGLSSIARNLFSSDSGSNGNVEGESTIQLSDVDVARFLVSGPIEASAEHRSYTIEVNPSVVVITLYSDYGQKPLDQKSYTNNQRAYDSFLQALDAAGVETRISGTTTEDDLNFEGRCASGRRYVVNLDDDFQRWSASCSSVEGTIAKNRMSSIRRLFNRQAPDAKEILEGTGLFVN